MFIITNIYIFIEIEITRRPCDTDLHSFDLIRQFGLDLSGAQLKYPGVIKVRGSSRLQTAYRLDRTANLTLPTKYKLFLCTSLKIIPSH